MTPDADDERFARQRAATMLPPPPSRVVDPIRNRRKREAKKRKLARRDGLTCQICFGPLTFRTATIDHIQPISLGGTHALANLRLAHRSCNIERGNGYPGGKVPGRGAAT